MTILFLIPARAGSKGLPGKNSRPLGTKPLIAHSIDFAVRHKRDEDTLCVSTNDPIVMSIAERAGVPVPFVRPEHLANDSASMHDVVTHALDFYREKGRSFDAVMLLQPTSPLRAPQDYHAVLRAYDEACDMVVTVKHSKDNPYFNLFEEDESGFLKKSKAGSFQRRQDCPNVYAYNGSIYLIRVASLKTTRMHELMKIRKVIMPEERSIDIDTMVDWIVAEHLMSSHPAE